jgi:hypothetical protein
MNMTHKLSLFFILVAILIDRGWGQTCRKSGSGTDVSIHDCDNNSYQSLYRNFQEENFVRLDAGNKNNIFTMIENTMFQNMNYLAELELGSCEIKSLDENAFMDLIRLEKLAIDHNKLEIIHRETFKQNKKLRELLLDSNNIHAVAEGTFDGLTKLVWVNLYENLCINKEYGYLGSHVSIALSQVSSDLNNCNDNYKIITVRTTSKKTSRSPSTTSVIKFIETSPTTTATIFTTKAHLETTMEVRPSTSTPSSTSIENSSEFRVKVTKEPTKDSKEKSNSDLNATIATISSIVSILTAIVILIRIIISGTTKVKATATAQVDLNAHVELGLLN